MRSSRDAASIDFFTTSSTRVLELFLGVGLDPLPFDRVRTQPHVELLAAADVVVEVLRLLTTIIRRFLDAVGLIREVLLQRVDLHLLLAGDADRHLLLPRDRRAARPPLVQALVQHAPL